MKKKFDCVEMKHKAQDRLRRELHGMTPEQELAFWKEKTEEMRRRREAIRKKRAAS